MPYVERAVLVAGYPALLAGVGLRDLARRGFFDRVDPRARAELLAVIAELEQAGNAYRQAIEPAGNPETRAPEIPAHSAVSAEQASILLRLSPRRVRQLADILGGVMRNGRWQFDRAAVLAEAQRRRERDGHESLTA